MAPSNKKKGPAAAATHKQRTATTTATTTATAGRSVAAADRAAPPAHGGGGGGGGGRGGGGGAAPATAPRRVVAKVAGGSRPTPAAAAPTPRIRATVSAPPSAPGGPAAGTSSSSSSTGLPKIVLRPGLVQQHRQQVEQLFAALENKDSKAFDAVSSAVLDSLRPSGASGPAHPLLALHETEMFDDRFTWSLLHAAAYHSNLKAAKILMGVPGADVEVRDTWYGGTPLAWAAFGGALTWACACVWGRGKRG
ncbi:MAG: hypothetical protein BJ554DRAFT_6192 [Olpidium bornovanus]|uniref:Uncharacterized protein n=1 Tax=Olpidium bornovanus TaxID=278681 RepID=A0A8H8A235_9FUNG|nr:MAG: hypothetical protein BJ554DRAFT_6192 [Olpidium bornovanus]